MKNASLKIIQGQNIEAKYIFPVKKLKFDFNFFFNDFLLLLSLNTINFQKRILN